MPRLVKFTGTGIYNTIMINPLVVVAVAKEDEDGKPFMVFEPHPKKEDRVYVTDSYEEIVDKLNAGMSDK